MDTIILDNSEIETVIIRISEFPESSRKWADITNKPAVIAAGATIQEALEQIGLENVNAEITSLQATKVDKVAGLGLSQENFTTTLKNKLDSITAIFTTALKKAYDGAVTWISTNGTNILNHLASTSNPHSVTKTQVGLGSVDDTPDTAKPVSTAQQTALNLKINSSLIGANNGVASLNSSGKVPLTQLSITTTDVPEGTNKYNATHTGEVTGSTALTITNKAVTLAKIQDISANSILGNDLAVAGAPKSLTPVGLTLSGDKVYNAVRSGIAGTPTNIITANNISNGRLAVNSTTTGAIKIPFPAGVVNSFYTIYGYIKAYGIITHFAVSANPAAMTSLTSATISGSAPIDLTVRFFTDGTSPYIAIGQLAQNWDYLQVAITGVVNSFSNATLANTTEGWNVSLITSFTGTQESIITNSNARVIPNLNQPVSDYVAASGVNTPLTNAMSPLQMFQNLQKQNDNTVKYSSGNINITGNINIPASGAFLINDVIGQTGIQIIPTNDNASEKITLFVNNTSAFVANYLGNVGIKNANPTEALDVTGKARVSVAPTNATDVVRLSDMSIVNTTTIALSSAILNSTYPNVIVGFRVICHLITGAPAIYTKATENGSSDVWLTTSAVVTP